MKNKNLINSLMNKSPKGVEPVLDQFKIELFVPNIISRIDTAPRELYCHRFNTSVEHSIPGFKKKQKTNNYQIKRPNSQKLLPKQIPKNSPRSMKHLHLKKRAAPRDMFRSRESISNFFPENQILEHPNSKLEIYNKMLDNYQNKSQFKAIKEEPEGIYQNPKSRNRDGSISQLISFSSNQVKSKHRKDSDLKGTKQTDSKISRPTNSENKIPSTANIKEEYIFQGIRGAHLKEHYLSNHNPENTEIQRVRSSQLLKNANNKSNQFIGQRLNLTTDSKETQKIFHRNYMNKHRRKKQSGNNDKVSQPQNLINFQAMEESKRSDQTNDSYFHSRRNTNPPIRMKSGFSQTRLGQISPRRPTLIHRNEVLERMKQNNKNIRGCPRDFIKQKFDFTNSFALNPQKNTIQDTVQNTDQNLFKNSFSKDKSLDTSIRVNQKNEYSFSFSKQDYSNCFNGLKSRKSMNDFNESNKIIECPIKEESRQILSKFAPKKPNSQRNVAQSTDPRWVVKSYNSFEQNMSRNVRKEDNDSKRLSESK